jgi:hypothetical protein
MADETIAVHIEVTLRARNADDVEKLRDAIEDGDEVCADLLELFSQSQSSLLEESARTSGCETGELEIEWDFVMVHEAPDLPPDVLPIEAGINLIVSEDDADYFWDLFESAAYQRAAAERYEVGIKQFLAARGLAGLVLEYRSECTGVGGGW